METTCIFRNWGAAMFAAVMLGLAATPVQASDSSARSTMYRASQADNGTLDGQERAFLIYWDAFKEADSDSLRRNINDKISELDARYRRNTTACRPPFFDRPYGGNRDFYEKYAAYQSARGRRLYGELLLMEGDSEEGMEFIRKAAEAGDGRAAFILAEDYAYGRYGTAKDYSQAVKWLNTALSAGYAPAYERMAAISWDGSWNQAWNQQSAKWYLDQAISKYSTWKMNDAALQEKFESYIEALKHVSRDMEVFMQADFSELRRRYPDLAELYFSYDALCLDSFCSDTSSGIRARTLLVQREMATYRGTYKLGVLANVDLTLVPIAYSSTPHPQRHLGVTTWSTTDSTFQARIDVYPHEGDGSSSSDPVVSSCATFMELMTLDNTIAHELAHVYFSSRYPQIAGFSSGDCKMTFEGHATNAAYEYINHTYFDGDLTPESYARLFLSSEYREYFFWFRRECLSPSGLVFWDKLDRWERDASGNSLYKAHTRRQTCPDYRSAVPEFDTPGFHCWF